jgi:transposase InsO family protein
LFDRCSYSSGTTTLRCFTSIYSATSWPKIVEITDKRTQTVMDAFHNNWLCCYPRPIQVNFDYGSEFKSVFKEMCDSLGIKCSPTTSYNPQGNSVVERIHQVMGNMLRAFELEDRTGIELKTIRKKLLLPPIKEKI